MTADARPRPDPPPDRTLPTDSALPADRGDRPTRAGAEPVVTLVGAAVEVGGRTIWSNVELTVLSGEFVAVLGPNGVGKSTLIKAILGIVPLAGGQLRVMGEPAGGANRRIGYLPQRRSFDPGLRIRGVDIVRMGVDGNRFGLAIPGRRSSRARREAARIDEAIDLVGATAYAARPIGQISGGEQQRLLIAQALVQDPDLLLLDEPLDSLDLPNQASVAALIADICAEGVAVMLVAHDVNPILGYLDRVVYLAHGARCRGRPTKSSPARR